MHGISTRITRSLDALAPWKEQWDALAAARGLPMLYYAWFLAAEQHLAEPGSVRVICVLDARDTLTAACALELRQDSHGRQSYQILGMPRLYEPSALLYRDPTARNALIKALAGLDHPVVLARVWPDASGTDAADRRWWLSRHALVLGKHSAPSQYLELAGDYAQYHEGLPSQRRYDLRRAYRRAESAGHLRCEILTPAPDDIQATLATAFAVEALSWKGRQGCAVLANAGLREFFFTMAHALAVERRVLVALLYSDATPIAAQFCLLDHQRLWLLKIGYDEAYARLSPGLILMNEVIKHSYREGLAGIEFLGSAEDWVAAWRPSLREYRLLALYAYTPRSLVRLGADIAGALQRNLRRTASE